MNVRQTELEQVRLLTNLLRHAADPFWGRIRTLLAERNIDPATSLVGACFPDDTSFEFGILVTKDGGVFQFGYDYLGKGVGEGTFTEWDDITNRHPSTPSAHYAAAALEILAGGGAG